MPRNAREVVVSKMEIDVSKYARISLHPIVDVSHQAASAGTCCLIGSIDDSDLNDD